MSQDSFNTKTIISSSGGDFNIFCLNKLEKQSFDGVQQMPFSLKVLLESLLRSEDGYIVTREHIETLARWSPRDEERAEIPFKPARVLMQDLTGVPAVVDLAAMRSALKKLGGDPKKINPLVPVDLVIDHSVQVDFAESGEALAKNADIEFERNNERYEFLAWGAKAFDNFKVVPPATGICHQVNLEFLAKVVRTQNGYAFPDTLVGMDSHTPMVNALGVLGWGVGGIEAEAVMLGQPVYMLIPDVVGFRFTGELKEGVTATDLTLTVVEMLRTRGVVGKFVEFYGQGLSAIPLPDRATIANMAPEYGATVGFFPVDNETLDYLRRTGRPEELIDLVEQYTKEQGLFRTDEISDPDFSDALELDLSTVEPSLAGPKRPHDRISLGDMKTSFNESLTRESGPRGFGLMSDEIEISADAALDDGQPALKHGSIVLAAITSCTNTSNPSVMLAAGLLSKKAVEKGLSVPSYIKTSFAPGSRVVTEYLEKSGTLKFLEKLGFNVVGYGCTTCIGNSGSLHPAVEKVILDHSLVVSSVLSGNRNFEGRVHPLTRANYLTSPPLVVALAIAGRVNIDMEREPLGEDKDGNPVYLRDIWPAQKEIQDAISQFVSPDQFKEKYRNIYDGNEKWNAIEGIEGDMYDWDENSTYIQEPYFFRSMKLKSDEIQPVKGARVLALLGDSVTTDHISPAGAIPINSPAGEYLKELGVKIKDFNTYGSRRGNHHVMVRGTFGNIRIRNLLVSGSEGGVTKYFGSANRGVLSYATTSDSKMSIYDAAMKYKEDGVPLIVIAGKDYGAGSSRDWAAKGTYLLGVKAVIAESFERIHRSNLIGMGVLPLEFKAGENLESFGLAGKEVYDIEIPVDLKEGQEIQVRARKEDGSFIEFDARCRIDTPVEAEYYRNGGILQTVIRNLIDGNYLYKFTR